MRDPVAGVYSVISGPGSVCRPVHLWFVASLCFAKSGENLFCEIVDDPWWFLDEFWCQIIDSMGCLDEVPTDVAATVGSSQQPVLGRFDVGSHRLDRVFCYSNAHGAVAIAVDDVHDILRQAVNGGADCESLVSPKKGFEGNLST